MRAISNEHADIIKTATASAYEAIGGVSRAADALCVASSTLTKYASTGKDWRENFIRLDLAIELDRRNDYPFLLNAMTSLVRADRVAPTGKVNAFTVLKLNGVLDDVVREFAAALEDGEIDAAERLAVSRRIVAAQEDLARLNALMMHGGRYA